MARSDNRSAAVGGALCALLLCSPVSAADAPARLDDRWQRHPHKNRIFFFAGGDIARDSSFGWAGIVGAPTGLLDEDGWRFRIMGGGGRYRYRTSAVATGDNEGTVSSGEFMLGYRATFGASVATVFLGAHVESQRLKSPDPGHRTQGAEAGAKIALELYRRFAPSLFGTASASASTVHAAYSLRGALALEHPSGAATGFEVAMNGDERYQEPRAGLFVQATYGRTTVSLAGGYLSNSDKGSGAYGTVALNATY
jgi:hypothetical protein